MTSPKQETPVHIIIPDTQQKKGVPNVHLGWIGQYIADEYDGCSNLTVIHLGDHWDMPSLSSYDKGKKSAEGRRYLTDVKAGNEAFWLLHDGIANVPARRVFLHGNHENRIVKAIEADAQNDAYSLDDLVVNQNIGWETHDFLAPVTIDGITYAHYFKSEGSSLPIGGSAENILSRLGFSGVQGHKQGFKYARKDGIRGGKLLVVAGSCYIHDEDYLTPQTVNYWRGIVVLHNVRNGDADLMQVSLDYLARRYEGKPLSSVKWRK